MLINSINYLKDRKIIKYNSKKQNANISFKSIKDDEVILQSPNTDRLALIIAQRVPKEKIMQIYSSYIKPDKNESIDFNIKLLKAQTVKGIYSIGNSDKLYLRVLHGFADTVGMLLSPKLRVPSLTPDKFDLPIPVSKSICCILNSVDNYEDFMRIFEYYYDNLENYNYSNQSDIPEITKCSVDGEWLDIDLDKEFEEQS